MPTSGEMEVHTISCVPARSAWVAGRSPPSAPPQKALIFILPPVLAASTLLHLLDADADRMVLVDAVGELDGAVG